MSDRIFIPGEANMKKHYFNYSDWLDSIQRTPDEVEKLEKQVEFYREHPELNPRLYDWREWSFADVISIEIIP